MNQICLPKKCRGEWIWKSSLTGREDAFLLLRKTFELESPALDNYLWITANCAYQLFINERLVGFGPRAHHGGASYVDRHDITCYLQNGLNAIAVVAYCGQHSDIMRNQPPGIWCQVECGDRTVAFSDASWLVCDGDGHSINRPRAAATQVMTEFIDNTRIPPKWTDPMFQPDAGWGPPDRQLGPTAPGADLEIYPLEPSTIASLIDFRPKCVGRVEETCAWTQVCFGPVSQFRRAAWAAATYLYSETDSELPVRIFADDPFRFFCNNSVILSDERSGGEKTLSLPLRHGWNRLLLVMEPGCSSMGLFLLFPSSAPGGVRIYQDTIEGAKPCWNVVGPLKLLLANATPSLKFERLHVTEYRPEPDAPIDVSSWLETAKLTETAAVTELPSLRAGEFFRASLDILRYGFPVLAVEAAEGDLIDLSLGYRPGPNGMPSRGKFVRAAHTLRCRDGLNVFIMFNPREGLNLMVSVRRAAGEVKILDCGFEELLRVPAKETLFSSSDETLNLLWKIGVHTLRRSSSFVPQIEPRAEYDTYLVDAYIDAVNMVVTFGDHAYAAARLRQFIDAQFENGDIPVLTFCARHRSQVHHLFFLPIWMLYNYRTSGDLAALKSMLPQLELLWDFFQSLIDDKVGLIGDVDTRFSLQSRLSEGKFGQGSMPTYLNALYCRFLLSLAEVYRAADDPGTAKRAVKQAQAIASRLRTLNFDRRSRLFVRKTEAGRSVAQNYENEHNLFANFTALLSGVMDLQEFEHFFFTFFRYDSPYDRSPEARNPYFHFLFLETMFALGQGAWATRYFRYYWSKRICRESGSWLTWRGDPDPAPVRFYDGNVVSPNVFLVREVAGVRTADAGHASIYFNPALEQADWVDLLLPTAFGKIRVRWEKRADGSLYVLIDANYPVKVLPELSDEQLLNTEFELSENVVLLQKPK